MFPAELATAAADVMVTLFDATHVEDGLRLAANLRSAGLRVDVYPEADKLGKQFKYAASRGVRFVTIEGEDERTKGVVTVKNMTSGEQQTIPRVTVADHLRAAMSERAPSDPRRANSEQRTAGNG